jgi:hypothetical protein
VVKHGQSAVVAQELGVNRRDAIDYGREAPWRDCSEWFAEGWDGASSDVEQTRGVRPDDDVE